MMLISSDPAVSSFRVKHQKKSKSVSLEVLKLIQEQGLIVDDKESDDNDDDSLEKRITCKFKY